MKRNNWVLLLRGVNMAGKNILPMKELVSILQALGLEGVRTYIQSGNVVFQSAGPVTPALCDAIRAEIEIRKGFAPRVLLLTAAQLESAVASNPFPEAEESPRTLHLFFLAEKAEAPDFVALERAKSDDERFEFKGNVFYLHAPGGVGRSKLAAGVERRLGVQVTARNWRTVTKLLEMVQES